MQTYLFWLAKRLRLGTHLGVIVVCLALFPAIGSARMAPQENWSTYLGSNARTDFNASESRINASNVKQLHPIWTYVTKGNISSQPLDVQGIGSAQIFWGSWDGNEYAADVNGTPIWSTFLGQTFGCDIKQYIGVAGTATIVNGPTSSVLYVAGGDGNLYALSATSGAILWKTTLIAPPNNFIYSSPAIYNGSIYIGVGVVGDGGCPDGRGEIDRVDEKTGVIENTFYAVPQGCIGGDVWSSQAIDESAGTIFVTTGNPSTCLLPEVYAPSFVELSATDLSVVDYWRVPQRKAKIDDDFGATPTLFTATIGGQLRQMVGAINKNGTYYALDRTSLHSGPLWQSSIGVPLATARPNSPAISSSAWDGTRLYVGSANTKINGEGCLGSLRALDPATGNFLWQDCFVDGPVLAPISAVSGLVFVGEGTHFLAIDATTGNILYNYTAAGIIDGPATVTHGELLVGDALGNLYAFKP